ncbi:MAG TPA: endonuclease, partial [Methylomirabilota bacterium]|nr:endonuclease [Methylomirabilota bacterium]
VVFTREALETAAGELGVKLPKNLGDIIYSFRYRARLPESVSRLAPAGENWVILPAGTARYAFVATSLASIHPRRGLLEVKIPDATPGIISMYALTDEQALLARLRYNRLIDVFTGITCYPLQSHLRTTVRGLGQVETDELYVGMDRQGAHYLVPVQAKRGSDVLSVVQVWQDWMMGKEKFTGMICRPLAAQFMDKQVIAMFEFAPDGRFLKIAQEKHYRLVAPSELTEEELRQYRTLALQQPA